MHLLMLPMNSYLLALYRSSIPTRRGPDQGNSKLAPQSGQILVFNVKLGLAKATGKPIQEEQSG